MDIVAPNQNNDNSKLKLAFGYIRISDENQRGNYSLSQQKSAILDFAERNGYKIVRFFVDECKTGKVSSRKGFTNMVEACHSNKNIKALIFYHTDRYFRNEEEHMSYKAELRSIGVKIVAVMQPMIDETPEGYLLDTVMAGINAYYSRDLGRKSMRGMIGRWEEGWLPYQAPPGYVNIKVKEKQLARTVNTLERRRYFFDELTRELKPIEVDPLFGHLMIEAFEKYASSEYSYNKLADFLADKGLKNKNGGPISHSVIHKAITNPFYYGLMRWNGMEKWGKHDPLISKELFDACQYVTAKHRNFSTRRRQHFYLLRGLIYCPIHECKRKVSIDERTDGKKYVKDHRKFTAEKNLYHCTNNKGGCAKSYIASDKLEAMVEDEVKNIKFSQDFIELVKHKVTAHINGNEKSIQSQRQVLINRKTGFKQQQREATRSLITESDPNIKESIRELLKELENDMRSIDLQIADLEGQDKLDIKLIDEIVSLTDNLHQTYKDAPDDLKKLYLKLFFERIYVDDGKITEVIYNPLFKTLLEQQRCLISKDWLPG